MQNNPIKFEKPAGGTAQARLLRRVIGLVRHTKRMKDAGETITPQQKEQAIELLVSGIEAL